MMKPFFFKPATTLEKHSPGWKSKFNTSLKIKPTLQTKRGYFVVNPFAEKPYAYNFNVDLPEFHTAKQMVHKHQFESAIASLTRGKDIITNSMGENHESVVKTEEMLSRLYFLCEKYEEALKLSMHILATTEEKLESLAERIKAYEHAIECCKLLGKIDEAIGLAGAAAILCRQQHQWKEFSAFFLELGSLYLVQGQLEEAFKFMNNSAEIIQLKEVKSDHLQASLFNNLGCYYKADGDATSADMQYGKALKIATRLKHDKILEADILSNRGEALIETKDYSEAQAILERAFALHTEKYSKGHEKVVSDMILLASCSAHLENNKHAESLLKSAEGLCEVALDKADMAPAVKQHYQRLLEQCLIRNAALLEKQGRHAEATQLQERLAKTNGINIGAPAQ